MSELLRLRHLVFSENACALPGVTVRYDTFIPAMWSAVAKGYVEPKHASFVSEGLRYGFLAGVQVQKLTGHRWFRNYPTAVAARDAVTRATMKRVEGGKTLHLGPWSDALGRTVRATFGSSFIVPLGAVPKPLEPTEMRPTSDHTRTGLNANTDLSFLKHSLDTYNEIAWFLKQDYFMRVSDVDAAFPLLPLHPDLWPFFLFRFFASNTDSHLSLFCHLCGDFGAAGMPGVFKIFFVDVVVNMARAMQVLTLPMPVYVDDTGLIGPNREDVDAEMLAFHEWAWAVCGVAFKALKDRVAAQCQLMLGFWWDSRTLTRTLDERKLFQYVEMLADFAGKEKLSLREMQVAAGRMQRAVMTLPPGAACLLVGLFSLMAGLKLPWHARRLKRGVREDFRCLRGLLDLNLGKGFYTYEHFQRAPTCYSDASKSQEYTGGGWFSQCGVYSFFEYGSRAARRPIDFLEGDTVVHCVQAMGAQWKGKVVPFGVDNSAFQLSFKKARSKASRLTELIRELFVLQIEGEFILELFWLSTLDNRLADHLSRNRELEFLEETKHASPGVDLWVPGVKPVRHSSAGEKRRLPETRGSIRALGASGKSKHDSESSVALRQTGDKYSSNSLKDGPSMSFNSTVPYSRASLFMGLPNEFEPRLNLLLDNRLSASSWRTVAAGMKRWRASANRWNWPVIIPSDDPNRGGKLVAFVLELVDDTDLVYASIENYVWGVRNWMKLQHQADPVFGIMQWDDFMLAVKVLTWAPTEPRKPIPMETVYKILNRYNERYESGIIIFDEVQRAFFLLLLLYTFSRSECPCPKTYKGKESFDTDQHWQVKDIDFHRVPEGGRAVRARFKSYKQDRRMERPEARGDEDWAYLGEIPDSPLCPVRWLLRLNELHGPRGKDAPFFLDSDQCRPLIYRKALQEFKEAQVEVGVSLDEACGLHALRVTGYNQSKAALGVELTVAHGGWRSSAHTRYERFTLKQVLRIPSAIAGVDPGDTPTDTEERTIERPDHAITRASANPGSPSGLMAIQHVELELPPGWTEVSTRRGTRESTLVTGPKGEVVASPSEAWKIYMNDHAAGNLTTVDPSLHA